MVNEYKPSHFTAVEEPKPLSPSLDKPISPYASHLGLDFMSTFWSPPGMLRLKRWREMVGLCGQQVSGSWQEWGVTTEYRGNATRRHRKSTKHVAQWRSIAEPRGTQLYAFQDAQEYHRGLRPNTQHKVSSHAFTAPKGMHPCIQIQFSIMFKLQIRFIEKMFNTIHYTVSRLPRTHISS